MTAFNTNFLYLAPSDRPVDSAITDAIADSAKHIQSWLRVQLGTHKTISRVVTSAQSDQDAAWFANHQTTNSYRDNFWLNSLSEAERLADAHFYDPFNTWVVFVDAELISGQYIGGTNGGGTNPSGMAVRDGPVIKGMLGLLPDRPACREHGGNAHELLHTFGIPHPDGNPLWSTLLMGTGYTIYPRCTLTDDEKFALNTNQFFSEQPVIYPPRGLCPFSIRMRPAPRARPVPMSRP